MAISFYDFLEDYDSESSANASITSRDGTGSLSYVVQSNTMDVDIINAIQQVLGYTEQGPGTGAGLARHLPVAHPYLPAFVASRMGGLKGVGNAMSPNETPGLATQQPSWQNPPLSYFAQAYLPQPMPSFSNYPRFRCTIDFAPRPYALFTDSQLYNSYTGPTWNAPNGAVVNYQYVTEWWRYLDFEFLPAADFITGIQGQSQFLTASGDEPNGIGFNALPKLFMQTIGVRMTWHEVPFRYIASPYSFIRQYLGRVNQNDWFEWGSGLMFPAGSLLYLSFTPRTYTSPIALTMPWMSGTTVAASKYVDIDFNFLYTDRTCTDAPELFNPNYIANGHNALPYFPLRQFNYAFYSNDASKQDPFWYSVPFELLFQDPDWIAANVGPQP